MGFDKRAEEAEGDKSFALQSVAPVILSVKNVLILVLKEIID